MGHIRQCRECGGFLVGRQDKIYCSDNCRSTYNNRLYKGSNFHIRSVNSILRKNRSILKKLIERGRSQIDKNLLYQLGFNFDYFTYEIGSKNGSVYRYCYEYGYCSTIHEKIKLVFRQEATKVLII